MFRHSLLLIFRNFKRFKSTFFINLVGLSIGLTCTLLIYLWVQNELTVDKFHEHDDRIYYAMEHRVKADGIWTSPNTSGPTAEALAQDMPEVEYTCAVSRNNPTTLSVDDDVLKVEGRFAGKDFFRIFSYPIMEGNKEKILNDKNSIVISESLALNFFNSTNVVGKVIKAGFQDDYTVAGVFKDVPKNATQQFEFLIPFEKLLDKMPGLKSWGNTGIGTYVLLKEGTDLDEFNKKIAMYVHNKTNNEITHRTLFLKKFSDIYLYGKYENGVLVGGRITYVKLFSVIAVFILIIACINFMNLSTAKASRRIKEVGIKKAVGAGRRTLVMQYMGESLLMSFLCMALAVLLVDILLDQFNDITGKQLSLSFTLPVLSAIAIVWLITGLLAGSYPAIYLSGFNPATVLKGKLNFSFGEVWARKGLVVFQFVLSIVLIASVMIVYKQIEYIQTKPVGYDRANVLFFNREGKLWEPQLLETFLAEVKRIPGVENASSIGHNMAGHNSGTFGITWEGKDPDDRTEFENVSVSYDLLQTLNIEMAEGRTFSRDFPADTASLIISEEGIRFMGMSDPIGKHVTLWGSDRTIVGVSKDFHYESLHENYKPLFFRLAPSDTHIVMIKLKAENQPATIAKIEQLYKTLNAGFSFDFKFLDAQYQSQYVAEQRVGTLSKYFAALAILISCLGLYGLAAFTAERRLKEIGIRKVLGSSEFGIISLLSGDFTKIVFMAIVIALPLSYFLTQTWLDDFAFKIDLEWWYFSFAGIMALLIAWLTVGAQAFKAARINPVKCLKDE
ncbi:ABC transporter permease [Fulvivirgaceae bacterium PWU20]|uniref:ABC transporter permease n=2 Tax=Chryseosolibacter indicus TaxID=2782351 RepID=A0ABS5VRQ3_9BACT|nr:ABC transporter permease [Chryseosolibacter indicus]